MRLELIRKDPASNSGDCPAVYRVADGEGHVVVGLPLTDDVEFAAGLKDGEVAVYVPKGVLAE